MKFKIKIFKKELPYGIIRLSYLNGKYGSLPGVRLNVFLFMDDHETILAYHNSYKELLSYVNRFYPTSLKDISVKIYKVID